MIITGRRVRAIQLGIQLLRIIIKQIAADSELRTNGMHAIARVWSARGARCRWSDDSAEFLGFFGFCFQGRLCSLVCGTVGNCSIAIAIKLCWNSEHQLSIAQRSRGWVAPSTCSRVTSGLLISEALPLSWAHSCSSFEAHTTELWSSLTDCKSSKFLLNLNFLPCFLVQSPQGFLMSPSTESRSIV